MISNFILSNKNHKNILEIDFNKIEDIQSLNFVFYRILDTFGLKNISYFCVEDAQSKMVEPVVLSTYTTRWQSFYRNNDLFLYDPVLYQTFTGLLPMDWSTYDTSKNRIKNVISLARDFNIGNFGLSIPVRGPTIERAIISITFDGTDTAWNELKSDNLKDFILLSHLIHQSALRLTTSKYSVVQENVVSLTPREMQCLYWASQGKTVYETGLIMGISKNTVRAYIESARHSLNCVSITQAVSKAIQLNLMPIYLKMDDQ